MKRDSQILIFGLGSEILTDDGIGTKICNELSFDPYFQHLNYETALLFSIDLINTVVGFETVIFIDATLSKDGRPGDLNLYEFNSFQETLHLSNVHEAKFKETLEFWNQLSYDIPKNIYVISIEIENYLVFGNTLSKELSRQYNQILNQIKAWIHHLSLVHESKEYVNVIFE